MRILIFHLVKKSALPGTSPAIVRWRLAATPVHLKESPSVWTAKTAEVHVRAHRGDLRIHRASASCTAKGEALATQLEAKLDDMRRIARDLPYRKSALILQPGPAALTDGVSEIHEIVTRWGERHQERAAV